MTESEHFFQTYCVFTFVLKFLGSLGLSYFFQKPCLPLLLSKK